MISRVLILLIALFWISGCKLPTDENAIKTIDSLRTVIDSIEINARQFTYEEADRCLKVISADMDSLKRFMTSSKLEKEEMNKIIGYYSLKKSFDNYRLFSRRFTEEIEYSKTQMQNLRHDIEKNLLPPDSVKKFIETEKNGVRKFESIVENSVRGILTAKKQFDEHYPEVEKIRKRLAVTDSVECD